VAALACASSSSCSRMAATRRYELHANLERHDARDDEHLGYSWAPSTIRVSRVGEDLYSTSPL
jgi:hypothetical protein